ncbi:hypothetical protein [Sphingobium scionense]|uniref:Uncharacterized protein n=1 Tax=Sphingobium scionense TaxID=1404341 RepID=A0A7W6LQ32_9SPHN|nr:hypothetical protein [Sphingobium scionense]MBB4148127.1 hypothetical protein [Sphingobium scionense]
MNSLIIVSRFFPQHSPSAQEGPPTGVGTALQHAVRKSDRDQTLPENGKENLKMAKVSVNESDTGQH